MVAEVLQLAPVTVRPGLSSDNHQSFGSQASIELGQMMVDRLGEKKGSSALSTDIRTYKDEFHLSEFLVINQVSLGVGKGVRVENKLRGQEEVVDTIFSQQGEPAETWLWEGETGGKVYQEVLDIYHTVASSNEDMTAVWVSYRDETERNKGQNVRIYKLEKKGEDAVLTSYTAGGSESSMWNFMDNITGEKNNRSSSISGTATFLNSGGINHQKVFNTLISSLDDQEIAKSKDILQRFRSEMHMSDGERTLLNEQKEEAIKEQLEEEMLTNEDVKTAYALVAQAVAASVEETQTNRSQSKYNILDPDTTSLVEVGSRQTTVEKKPLETEVERIKETNQPTDTEIFSREVVEEVKREEQDQERKVGREEIREDKNINNNAQIAAEKEEIKISDEPIQEVNKPEPLDSHEKDVEKIDLSAKENGEIKSPVKILLALYVQYIANYQVEDRLDSQDETVIIDQSEGTTSENNTSRETEKKYEQLPEKEETILGAVLQVIKEIERFIEKEEIKQVDEVEEELIDVGCDIIKTLVLREHRQQSEIEKNEDNKLIEVNIPQAVANIIEVLESIIGQMEEEDNFIKNQSCNLEEAEKETINLAWDGVELFTQDVEMGNNQNKSLPELAILLIAYNQSSISIMVRRFLSALIYEKLQEIVAENKDYFPTDFISRFDGLTEDAFRFKEIREEVRKRVYQAGFGQLEDDDILTDRQENDRLERHENVLVLSQNQALFLGDEIKEVVIDAEDSKVTPAQLRDSVLAVIEEDLESIGLLIDDFIQPQDVFNQGQIFKSILIVVFLDLYQLSEDEKDKILELLNISRDEIEKLGIYIKMIIRLKLLIDLCQNLTNWVNPEGIFFERILMEIEERKRQTKAKNQRKYKKRKKKKLNKVSSFPKRAVVYLRLPFLPKQVIYED